MYDIRNYVRIIGVNGRRRALFRHDDVTGIDCANAVQHDLLKDTFPYLMP